MYSTLKSVQYLVAMLKAKDVNICVISPGNSHNAIVRSIEEDEFFKTYNIVDERSAAYFAIGLIQEIHQPVAIICTAGTAVSNYLPGITEAFRRNLPLIAITADKNIYYLDQSEDQMIEQGRIFKDVVKCSKTLPIIRDKKDEWYCNRILNEAFLEMTNHVTGPIHINVPIEEGKLAIGKFFTEKELPKVNIIEKLDSKTEASIWKSKIKLLTNKNIMIIYGQDINPPIKLQEIFKNIVNKYNCIIAVDKLSNIHGEGILEISRAALYTKSIDNNLLDPDVVITVGGNIVLDYKFKLKDSKKSFEHWLVREDGKIADPFKKLTTIFQCSILDFFINMDLYASNSKIKNEYYNLWKTLNRKFIIPEFEYSNVFAIQKLMNQLPNDSLLNLANSTTIRLAQFFYLDESIKVFCNRGVNGIDGCMSTFIGQSCATNKLSFLIIGDLAFFYDMNSLWNRYIRSNIRIMLNNNEGAALFHFNQGIEQYPTLNENVAAEHLTSAKGWAENQGFKYLSARNIEEFNLSLEKFLDKDSDKPIILEVFTKKEEDARIQHEFYNLNKAPLEGKEAIKTNLKKAAKSVLSQDVINKLKSIKWGDI